ncbi:hypothetical protein PHYBOEH_001557 [Phytophthora boehmeriae]|uniref:RxLR effector protein n=1 Tax=Phytophthora boehmeriae TaxID=109152 RepID=A0A8T1WYU3_9STRA|nr:hypothetical protein PHYBOEH_001557 [Phytophthora boehmeriae]
MRIFQLLISTSCAVLIAANTGTATASDAVATSKTSVAATTASENASSQKVPFKYGNVTGLMVITIDKDSLRENDDSTFDSENVIDLSQLDSIDDADEERAISLGALPNRFKSFMIRMFQKWRFVSGVRRLEAED